MRAFTNSVIVFLTLMVTESVYATRCTETGITISKIRAVADYTSGDQHDDTLELHHDTRSWCDLSVCTSRHRVVIDKERSHLVAAAYLAFASGKKVDITIDDALTDRSGICEVSILDVVN